MGGAITSADLERDPSLVAGTVTLPDGERVGVRALAAGDAARLGEYFVGLSETTRSLYGPHPFDQATADALCAALEPSRVLRLVATVPRGGDERIVAYVILHFTTREGEEKRYAARGIVLDRTADCTLAPSVADDYQNRHLGLAVVGHLLDCLLRLGRRRVVLQGGVQARNVRGVHFYGRLGFVKVGEFQTTLANDDMILDLAGAPWRRGRPASGGAGPTAVVPA